MAEIKSKTKIQNDLVRSVSAALMVYQSRFLTNTQFLCSYTGLDHKSLASRIKHIGCPSPLPSLKRIEKNDNIGMEMLHFASVAKVFGIPFELMFEYDLWQLYEDKEFIPEKYNIFKNSMHRRKNMQKTPEAKLNPVPWRSAKKRLKKAVRYNQIQRDMEIANAIKTLRDNGI